MSHGIETMWDAERVPWWEGLDGLHANVTKKRLTAKEAVKAAGMHEIEKRPLYAYLGANDEPSAVADFTPLPSHDTYALVEKDTKRLLTTCKRRYQPIVPLEMAEFLLTLLDAGDLVLVSGAVLQGGIDTFFCAQLPDDIRIGGLADETIEQYATFLNHFRPGQAGEVFGSGTRSVCRNTVRYGRAEGKRVGSYYRIVHDSTYKGRLAEARESLKLVYKQSEDFKAEMETLLNKAANEKTLKTVYEQVFPTPDPEVDGVKAVANWKSRWEQVQFVWTKSPNLENVRPTQYGVFNAITEWAEHGRSYYGTGGDAAKQATKRAEEVLMGRTREIEAAALNVLLTIPGVRSLNLAKTGKKTTVPA